MWFKYFEMLTKINKLVYKKHAANSISVQRILFDYVSSRSYAIQPQDRLKIVYEDFNWAEYHKNIS